MRVLMIGGMGFTGPHIVRALVEAEHAVTVVHSGHHAIEITGVEEIRGEIGKLREMAGQLRATIPEVVVASTQDVYAAFGGGHLFAMCHRSLPTGPEVVVQRSPWVSVQRPEPLRGILAE